MGRPSASNVSERSPAPIAEAQCVLACETLDPTLTFFTETLDFRVETIHPADDPSVAVISGYGLRIRLERGRGPSGSLRLLCEDLSAVAARFDGKTTLNAPNGTHVELVEARPEVVVPETKSAFVLSRSGKEAVWGTGRAGMLYRDLIPDRLGGSFIASHIRIPDGGPVPDYVHYHRIRFQMIYSYRGWARLVYEDQGPPFLLKAGDCVLQPPEIRHRVLECSDGMEVVEIGCPAEHETFVDHDLELPTGTLAPGRDFGGQRFVRHQVASAKWAPYRLGGFEQRDLGIGNATDGLAGARVVRVVEAPASTSFTHDAPFLFQFVLDGSLVLETGDRTETLGSGDAFALPPHTEVRWREASRDLEILEVSLPANFRTDHGSL